MLGKVDSGNVSPVISCAGATTEAVLSGLKIIFTGASDIAPTVDVYVNSVLIATDVPASAYINEQWINNQQLQNNAAQLNYTVYGDSSSSNYFVNQSNADITFMFVPKKDGTYSGVNRSAKDALTISDSNNNPTVYKDASTGVITFCLEKVAQETYPADAMVMLTDPSVNEVTLRFDKGEVKIDWGDGTITENFNGQMTHTYNNQIQNTIIVTKTSNEGGSNGANTMVMTVGLGIKEVKQWYEAGYEILGFCLNVSGLAANTTLTNVPATAPKVYILEQGQSSPIFLRCAAINDPNIGKWDVSKWKNFNQMFQLEAAHTQYDRFNIDVSNWDMSSAISTNNMFLYRTLFNQNLSKWNMSNVTMMTSMFENCVDFDQDLSKWCVPNIQELPVGFATGTSLAPAHYPVWGTCSNG